MAYKFDDMVREIAQSEPTVLYEINQKFGDVVFASFKADGSTKTRKETRRRLDICAKWFQTMRRDVRWSRQRAYDHLAQALRCELDGIPYSIHRENAKTWWEPESNIWLPD
jgi:hypothetical protein